MMGQIVGPGACFAVFSNGFIVCHFFDHIVVFNRIIFKIHGLPKFTPFQRIQAHYNITQNGNFDGSQNPVRRQNIFDQTGYYFITRKITIIVEVNCQTCENIGPRHAPTTESSENRTGFPLGKNFFKSQCFHLLRLLSLFHRLLRLPVLRSIPVDYPPMTKQRKQKLTCRTWR